jgi:phage FluMu protein Com
MDVKPCPPSDHEVRCSCGSLMARVTTAGLEFKCRRCKRIVVVSLPRKGEWVPVP